VAVASSNLDEWALWHINGGSMEKRLDTWVGSDDSTKTYLLEDLDLPLVVEPVSPLLSNDLHAARQWLDSNETAMEKWLLTYGAVLLRGFPVASTTDFSYFIKSYPEHRFRYLAGGAPRAKYLDKVYESTKLPPGFKLALHQEKAYMATYPRMLAFHCVVAPESGGETILCDMSKIRGQLPPDLLSRFDEKGIKYVRNFRDANAESAVVRAYFSSYHRTWQEAFSAQDREEVERACGEMQLDYSWMPDGSVTVTHCEPPPYAIRKRKSSSGSTTRAHSTLTKFHWVARTSWCNATTRTSARPPMRSASVTAGSCNLRIWSRCTRHSIRSNAGFHGVLAMSCSWTTFAWPTVVIHMLGSAASKCHCWIRQCPAAQPLTRASRHAVGQGVATSIVQRNATKLIRGKRVPREISIDITAGSVEKQSR
jgi:hypothetical protein